MKKLCLALLIAASSAPAQEPAQEWAMRNGDALFSRAKLQERLAGQTLTFYDDGQSRFGPNGGYSYTYGVGGTAFGVYEIGEDSTVCIAFDNGASRCDLYVMNTARLIVVTEEGQRFPVRPAS